ncbi:DNA-binding XRE family transcriptional regulator [Frondihabitans sp. PhB188]|uniref:helix-turn-helix domain-containing protein n=1 Tax=Frondihabitans sp. PhB188 TaxID=2485200 RepID=UPI000F48D672|nr:helix-turn-helix transcriptional regulator [Frondihabitans sp. PhB188]ROQ41115.1 DNA-binding XRE family transcriptional regulator [Frondihabitans sp. PhB188]
MTPQDDAPTTRKPALWRELVGEQLRGRRESRDESLRSVAKRAGVSPQYLSEVERGIKEPSSEILAAIGASLDASLLDLTAGVARRLHGDAVAARRGEYRLAA